VKTKVLALRIPNRSTCRFPAKRTILEVGNKSK